MKTKIYSLLFYLVALSILSGCSANHTKRVVVAKDGTGDYTTIQEAINAVPESDQITKVYIKSGIYKEKLVIPANKKNIHLLGENVKNTIITWDDYSGKDTINTFTSYTFKILGNDIKLENLTIENSEGMRGQAVALYVEGDRCLFVNCRIVGNQDTLYAGGERSRQYYKNCHIEGTTDFIFGSATAVFQNCDILCKKHSYITAASTPQKSEFGYVFINCKVEAATNITEVFLGRPWRDYANVVYLNCTLGGFIRPEGWHNWSKPEREKTAFYAEYNNNGAGADTTLRVEWSKQLTKEQASKYTVENILKPEEWTFQE